MVFPDASLCAGGVPAVKAAKAYRADMRPASVPFCLRCSTVQCPRPGEMHTEPHRLKVGHTVTHDPLERMQRVSTAMTLRQDLKFSPPPSMNLLLKRLDL